MPQPFNCPNCGAPLDYDGSGYPTMRCPSCNNSVVVPQELRVRRESPTAPASSPSSTPMMPVGQGEMFDLGNLLAQAGRFKELGELVRDGRKAEAVRLYRELLGVDEATATQAIEAMATNQPVVITSSMTTFDAPSVTVTASTGRPPMGAGGVGNMPGAYAAPVSVRPGRVAGAVIGVTGCVLALVVVGILGFTAAAVFGFLTLFKSHPVYQMAVSLAKNDPAVVELLGEPISDGWFVTGSIEESGTSGNAAISGSLSGPGGSADLSVGGFKNADGSWELSSVTVVSKDKSVVLTYSPETGRFQSSP